MSVAEGVKSGRLTGLVAMRDRLAASMDVAEPSVQAQLGAVLAKVLVEIESLEAANPEESESDRIARELAAGLSDASIVQLAGRGRKSRAG